MATGQLGGLTGARLGRRTVLGGLLGTGALGAQACSDAEAQAARPAPVPAAPLRLEINGDFVQSGSALGITAPGASVRVDDVSTRADSEGRFLLGFDRDGPATSTVTVTAPDGRTASRTLEIAPKTWRITGVSGLPSRTVNPPQEALARIERESQLKQRAFASEDPISIGFTQPFDWPLASIRVTSPWGAQRRLNGSLQRPHYGIDLGSPTGTRIRAPAPGLVVIAEPDMYFEGGMVALDHGQGLITSYLHMSRLDVRVGQRVERGAVLGAVGAKGRATGPHLCWRMRWRGRQLDPSLRTS